MYDFNVRAKPLQTPVDTCIDELVALMNEMPDGRLLVTVRGLPGAGVTHVLRAVADDARGRGWTAMLIDLSDSDPTTPFTVIARLANRIPFLIPLGPLLHHDASVDDIAEELVRAFVDAVESAAKPIMIALDAVERADKQSAAVLRRFLTHRAAQGVFVLGDLLSEPTRFGRALTRVVYEDADAHLFIVPPMTASEVAVQVAQRTGKRITHYEAERLRQTTGGRWSVVGAYLSSIDSGSLTDTWMLRSLPRLTSGRLSPGRVIDFGSLPRVVVLAAELISLQRQGISLQLLTHAGQQLGLDMLNHDDFVDGPVVVDSQTGLYELRDPLTAGDFIMRMSVERRRGLLGLLSTHAHGQDSLIHWIDSLSEVSTNDADAILAAAQSYENQGRGRFAVRALYHAAVRARHGKEYERLLLAFGFACVRNQLASQFAHAISDIAPLTGDSWEFAYVHTYLYAFRPHDGVLAQHKRAEMLARTPESVDQQFMQADIAWLDVLFAFHEGRDPNEALLLAERLSRGLEVERPENLELQWVHRESRLLQLEAYRRLVPAESGWAADAAEVQRIVEAADALPQDSCEAVNVLVMAAIASLDVGEIALAADLTARARARVDAMLRTPLLQGRLDVLELEIAIEDGTWVDLSIEDDWSLADGFDAFDQNAQVAWHAMRSWVAAVRGEFAAAQRHVDFASISDSLRVRGHASDWLAFARGFLSWHQHGADAALEGLEFTLDEPRNRSAPLSLLLRLELLTQTEQAAEAELALEQLVAATAHMRKRLPAVARGVARMEHLRGNFESAVEQLLEVVAMSDSPYHLGLAYLGLYDAYWKIRGKREQTIESLRNAREQFEAIEAQPFVDLIDRLQRSVRASSADRFVQLTTRERQTVVLAGQGWRNKEIAAELGISAATVAFHLSNAFEKLGLRKRSELSSLLQNGGLG